MKHKELMTLRTIAKNNVSGTTVKRNRNLRTDKSTGQTETVFTVSGRAERN